MFADQLPRQMLNLSCCGLGKEGATSVCGVFHSLRFMKFLVLSRNAIPSDALATIARTLSSRRSLELLDLSSTGAGDAGAHALLPLLQSAGCPRELNLKDNAIGTAGATRLLAAAASSHIMQVLDLSNNAIDDSVRFFIIAQPCTCSSTHPGSGCTRNYHPVLFKQGRKADFVWQLLGRQGQCRSCCQHVLWLCSCSLTINLVVFAIFFGCNFVCLFIIIAVAVVVIAVVARNH